MCRDLTTQLAPPTLYDDGFCPALRWLSDWFKEKQELKVNLELIDEPEPFNEELSVLLFQSVRELLFNVVKHAMTSEATVTVESGDAGWMKVTVTDRGRGFEAANAVAASTGGFGLFSLRERMGIMGGDVKLQSAPGQGTRVILSVPSATAAEIPPDSIDIGDADSLRRPPIPREGRTRVMLADDHAIVRHGLMVSLSQFSDVEVIGQASDGLEAIAMVRRFSPDVVLMDVNMPNLNGIEATRRIKAEMPHTTVIGLSVYSGTGTSRSMLDAGASAYIVKGGPIDELHEAIIRYSPRNV